MNELDLLELNIGGQKIREMSSFTFLQWMANKLSNIKAFSADAVELTALIQSPPMSRSMTNDKKIEIIKKLQKLNISIP